MAVPTIYRSTDANAPILIGGGQSLVDVLRACLVNGYGSTPATASLTFTGVNPSDGDTVTVGTVVYRFKTAPVALNDVLINVTAAITWTNLRDTINNSNNTAFFAGTLNNPDVLASANTTTTMTLRARKGGTAGNSLACSVTGTQVAVGAGFSGGAGTDTTAGLGWTEPYNATGKAVFKQASPSAGVPPTQYHLDVDDTGSIATALQKEAKWRLYRTMTAVGTGTDPTPTVAQAGEAVRKSAAFDNTARVWMLIGDETTFYFFTQTSDIGAGVWMGHCFGEFYSYVPGDLYKNYIQTRPQNSASNPSIGLPYLAPMASSSAAPSVMANNKVARAWSGAAASSDVCKTIAFPHGYNSGGSAASGILGVTITFPYPNPADGGTLLSPIYLWTSPTGNMVTQAGLHGQLRGVYGSPHPGSNFTDGDVIYGSGDYAGRTFLVVKLLETSGNAMVFIETTAWARST